MLTETIRYTKAWTAFLFSKDMTTLKLYSDAKINASYAIPDGVTGDWLFGVLGLHEPDEGYDSEQRDGDWRLRVSGAAQA